MRMSCKLGKILMNMMIGKSGWDLKEGYLLYTILSNSILASSFFPSLQVISNSLPNYYCESLTALRHEIAEGRSIRCEIVTPFCLPIWSLFVLTIEARKYVWNNTMLKVILVIHWYGFPLPFIILLYKYNYSRSCFINNKLE